MRAFPTGKAKPAELAEQLKTALVGMQGIRINEICFVATDSRFRDASVAAQLAVSTLGDDQDQFKQWLNDPQKLLEMIAAAQGATSGGGSGGRSGDGTRGFDNGTGHQERGGNGSRPGDGAAIGGGFYGTPVNDGSAQDPEVVGGGTFVAAPRVDAAAFSASGATSAGLNRVGPLHTSRSFAGEPSEDEILGILSALTSMGHVGAGGGSGMAAAGVFHEQMTQLPGRAQDTLKAALAELASHAPDAKPDQSMLVQLAEHLAIRFALERYEKGDVKVNAVRQMLDRMNSEIESLRKILGAHEDKMSEAGVMMESHREILDRQFWAAVPESGKRTVLLSTEAWCIPPRNVQSYVGELIEQGNIADAISVLQNYAACADSEETDARKRTAAGIVADGRTVRQSRSEAPDRRVAAPGPAT